MVRHLAELEEREFLHSQQKPQKHPWNEFGFATPSRREELAKGIPTLYTRPGYERY